MVYKHGGRKARCEELEKVNIGDDDGKFFQVGV